MKKPSRHFCPDETATVVNGRWICTCPGGPYLIGPTIPIPVREGETRGNTEEARDPRRPTTSSPEPRKEDIT